MSGSEVQKFEDVHEREDVSTASELDKKGSPATKLYNGTRRLVKSYSATK